jgi:ATP-dependent helicase/nuclease subunit A
VDQIAVITFTEAAAAELAARVRQGLERAMDESTDPQEQTRLHKALQGLHRAHLETIHAFAAGLLRERPVEAGLDPGFEILEGLAAKLAFDEEYDRWLVELLDGDHPEVATAIGRGFDLPKFRQLVETVHEHRSLLPFAQEPPAPAGCDAYLAQLARVVTELRSLLMRAARSRAGHQAQRREEGRLGRPAGMHPIQGTSQGGQGVDPRDPSRASY